MRCMEGASQDCAWSRFSSVFFVSFLRLFFFRVQGLVIYIYIWLNRLLDFGI